MILNIFIDLWQLIAKGYTAYSNFIHSILMNEAGDLAEYTIDIFVAFFVVRLAFKNAFHKDK